MLAVLKPLLSSGSDCIVRVLGLVACATCSTEVLAFRSESSELFQEHGDPQKEKLNEQRWQKKGLKLNFRQDSLTLKCEIRKGLCRLIEVRVS